MIIWAIPRDLSLPECILVERFIIVLCSCTVASMRC